MTWLPTVMVWLVVLQLMLHAPGVLVGMAAAMFGSALALRTRP